MERFNRFLDWKSQCCQSDWATCCNSYQITNGIFCCNSQNHNNKILKLSWKYKRPWISKAIFFFPINFISWRLITLQYCSGFCHTLTWIRHGFTCIPHPNPPSHLPLHPIPLGLPSAPGPSTCLMHPAWAGDLFHPG